MGPRNHVLYGVQILQGKFGQNVYVYLRIVCKLSVIYCLVLNFTASICMVCFFIYQSMIVVWNMVTVSL